MCEISPNENHPNVFMMYMTLKFSPKLEKLYAPMKSFRQSRRNVHLNTRAHEKGAGKEKRSTKNIFSFIRNSSKICNQNRDQKYVKFERTAENWLYQDRRQQKFSQKVFKIFLQTFKLCVLSLRFVLCKTLSVRRAGSD